MSIRENTERFPTLESLSGLNSEWGPLFVSPKPASIRNRWNNSWNDKIVLTHLSVMYPFNERKGINETAILRLVGTL